MPGIMVLSDPDPKPVSKVKKGVAAAVVVTALSAALVAPLAGHFIPNPGWIL